MRTNVDDLVKDSQSSDIVPIFNPLIDPFIVAYNGKEIIIPGHDIVKLPKRVAQYVTKHLRDHVMNVRGYKSNVYIQRKEIEKEISAND